VSFGSVFTPSLESGRVAAGRGGLADHTFWPVKKIFGCAGTAAGMTGETRPRYFPCGKTGVTLTVNCGLIPGVFRVCFYPLPNFREGWLQAGVGWQVTRFGPSKKYLVAPGAAAGMTDWRRRKNQPGQPERIGSYIKSPCRLFAYADPGVIR
jgi:hypothetical protein